MVSIEEFSESLKKHSSNGQLFFGMRTSLHSKFQKHLKRKDVRSLRNYLLTLKLAFPEKRVIDNMDPELFSEVKDLVSQYYQVNSKWKAGDDKWSLFIKIHEPPFESNPVMFLGYKKADSETLGSINLGNDVTLLLEALQFSDRSVNVSIEVI